MAKKERFALIMEDGAQVRNIDDLKAHFDIGSVVRDFSSGKLLTWLEDRYYDDEADAIKSISPDDYSLEYKLCKIFKVETPEDIERRIERLNRLKTFTDDENILANSVSNSKMLPSTTTIKKFYRKLLLKLNQKLKIQLQLKNLKENVPLNLYFLQLLFPLQQFEQKHLFGIKLAFMELLRP